MDGNGGETGTSIRRYVSVLCSRAGRCKDDYKSPRIAFDLLINTSVFVIRYLRARAMKPVGRLVR